MNTRPSETASGDFEQRLNEVGEKYAHMIQPRRAGKTTAGNLTAGGRIVGTSTRNDDGTITHQITDPDILKQIGKDMVRGLSVDHKLTADHDGEPVCACGFDPATISIVSTREDAVRLIRRHRDNMEECAKILRRLEMGTVSKEAARAALGIQEPTAPKPTIYIAGPMTGHPENNYPAFHQAAKDLRAAGYHVLNPAENPQPNPNPSWQDWMRAAIAQVIQADAIALLDGYGQSKGALVEASLGRDLGLDVRPIGAWLAGHDTSSYNPSASSK